MPDIRKKIEEYLIDLDYEIDICIRWCHEHLHSDSDGVSKMQVRIQTLLEVRNDLQGILDEVI